MKTKIYIIFLVLILSLSACSPESSTEDQAALQKIRLPMGFIANVQFAPFYVAVEKGYFAEAGIEIEFDYSFESDGVVLVGANELPFAVVSGEQVLLARTQEIPVVYVMSWYQEYPIAVVASKQSGVEVPSDLAGSTIGLPGLFGATYIGLRALLREGGVDEKDVTLNSIGFNQVEAFTLGQEEVIVGYFNNEPLQLAAEGFKFNVIRVADYVNLASNGIITNETTITEDPELIKRFITALIHGISDTLEDPDAAYQTSLNFVDGLSEDDEVQKNVLQLSLEFWETDQLGYSESQAWENMQTVLLEMDLLAAPLNLEEAFTNEFIE